MNEKLNEILAKNNMNWEVEKVPIRYGDNPILTEEYNGIIRSDNGRLLGIVGNNYEPKNNAELFQHFSPFLDVENTQWNCFEMNGGRKICLEGYFKNIQADVSKGDTVGLRMQIISGHAGACSTRPSLDLLRLICLNGATMMVRNGNMISRIKHTPSQDGKLQQVEVYLKQAMLDFDAQVEIYRSMQHTRFSKMDFQKFVLELFPPTEKKILDSKEKLQQVNPTKSVSLDDVLSVTEHRASTSGDVLDLGLLPKSEQERYDIIQDLLPRQAGQLEELFEAGKGSEFSRGTLYGAYNAVTEYIDHHRSRDSSDRESAILGSGADLRSRAYDLAVSRLS